MVWFKVDDKLHDHRKVRKAGKAAMGVWVLAGSWSMDNETDGFVPDEVLSRWGTTADARRLVNAGLWDRAVIDGEPGHRFHDWSRFQPSAAVTAAKRAKEHQGALLGNHKRWHVGRKITDPDCEFCYQVPDREPDRGAEGVPESPPNRPVPVPVPDNSVGDDKPSAQTLVAEWINACETRPPGRVVGQVARELGNMLGENIPYDTIRAGLIAWHEKNLNPAVLASVVHETQRKTIRPAGEDPNAWMRRTL